MTLELKFIDHVVIGHGEFYSIKESKMHYETGKCCRRG
jgi:DNA repair protein RadC